MAEQTKIEWCDHTFNPWIGCTKVSEACRHCYAEADMDKRRGRAKWGPGGSRSVTADATWKQPLAWNRKAKAEGIRRRVFCASLADVFEEWEGPMVDHQKRRLYRPVEDDPDTYWVLADGPGDCKPAITMSDCRIRLLDLIDATPQLDWLLLTKRPENAAEWLTRPRHNVWLGATVEDQANAEKRIPELLRTPNVAVRFLSSEPLLGSFDLSSFLQPAASSLQPSLDWVIAGGESGPGARPSHPDWFRSLRDQCEAAGVPFLFKQWGDWLPIEPPWMRDDVPPLKPNERWLNLAGGHGFHGEEVWRMRRVGKKAAGRMLDGVTHDGFPDFDHDQPPLLRPAFEDDAAPAT